MKSEDIKVVRDWYGNSYCIVWVVRIVRPGDRYGLDNCLIHTNHVPSVEFYDGRHGHTNLGQFVSRYHAPTLCKREGGLVLEPGVPEWKISATAMSIIRDWIEVNT